MQNKEVICHYVWAVAGEVPLLAEIVHVVTGFDYTTEELAEAGNRIWYLRRVLGNLMGATREDDQVPKRILEPHIEGKTSSLTRMMYPTYESMGPLGKMMPTKILEMTKKFANGILFPHLYRLMRPMRFMPGLWNKHNRSVPFDEMLEEYYREREIDESGRPSAKRLEELGLNEVARVISDQ